ncbi:hypothetical protein [Amycolatopsis samaneae]|uniref:Uncharacterized protein n=1 Tax=Amycolatopsis samaneae TaxID=664691 RepID=A0ABW5GX35_9PSEU
MTSTTNHHADRSRGRLARSAAAGRCIVCDTRDAHLGYACPECVNDVARLLHEIGGYWSLLPHLVEPLRGQTGRRNPGYGSNAPVRLAALDPATLPTPEDDVWSIPGTLGRIAEWIAEQRGGPVHLGEIGDHLRWCAERPGFEVLADAVHELHRRARQLARDRPQAALGRCLDVTCEGPVLEGGPGKPARCKDCGRPYVGLDLIRLGAAEDAA